MEWNKIEIDTKVLVSNDGEKWFPRYFAYYDGEVHCWINGRTSATAEGKCNIVSWKYAKLYQE